MGRGSEKRPGRQRLRSILLENHGLVTRSPYGQTTGAIPHAPAAAPGHESPHIVPIPDPLVVGEGFMPSRKRAGINPAPTVDEGDRRPDEGDFLTDDTE